jgi:plasmid stabilization system protein ParE
MACKINWTQRAWQTYEDNIKYLLSEWTEKEVSNSVILTDKKISNLSKHPLIGKPRNKQYHNIRCSVISKRVVLLYKYKPLKNEIDLLVFWNTYQNPRKLKIK